MSARAAGPVMFGSFRTWLSLGLVLLIASACTGVADRGEGSWAIEPEPPRYRPSVSVTWHWQLTGPLNTGYEVDIYAIDLFDTTARMISELKSRGRHVICYFSAGSQEAWRQDAERFDSAVLGQPLTGWPGERWLDIRSSNVRQIMLARLDLARRKGCDGVEPDNVDAHANRSGFALDAEDQLTFNRFLALQAHQRGLAIALKNNLEQVSALVDHFDFAINESCALYGECHRLQPFIDAGKPVLHVEYVTMSDTRPDTLERFCQPFLDRRFSTLVLPRALDDAYRWSCL